MATRNKASSVTSVDSTQRVLGAHVDCGGQVIYQTTPSMGWSYCDKCKASSMFGKVVEAKT